MRRLILLRHGKAERAAASGLDFDRALTSRGRADAGLIGRVLAERGIVVERALVSSAVRAAQTWAEVAPAFSDAVIETTRALYHADDAALWAAAQAASGETVLIVAHNPGLQTLAARLAVSGSSDVRRALEAGFPTAAAAVFAFAGHGDATVEGVFAPADFGGGAGA